MQSFHLQQSGAGLDGLELREDPDPTPGPGEALVAIRANSLSFRELMVLRGDYVLPVKDDIVPVSDGAGEVVAVGEGVTRVKQGDRVAASIFPLWLDGQPRIETLQQLGSTLDGLLRELAVLPEDALVPVPEHLSLAEASTLPCVGVTAWNALMGSRDLQAGETVLTLGTGGVSLFALQFAKQLGARVIATTGDQRKAARLRRLGADEVIDYTATPDWADEVRRLTGGRGADRVIEVTGQLETALKSVALGGEVAFVGFLAADGIESVEPMTLFYSCANLRAVAVGSRAQFVAMMETIKAGGLKPVVDRIFPFEESVAAYRYYQEARPFGKVVIANNRDVAR
jgi:NADPH:quinone reductase-like Zn-dependent oxidoreductase